MDSSFKLFLVTAVRVHQVLMHLLCIALVFLAALLVLAAVVKIQQIQIYYNYFPTLFITGLLLMLYTISGYYLAYFLFDQTRFYYFVFFVSLALLVSCIHPIAIFESFWFALALIYCGGQIQIWYKFR